MPRTQDRSQRNGSLRNGHPAPHRAWRPRRSSCRFATEPSTPPWRSRPSAPQHAAVIRADVEPVLIPAHCADGFFEAYWRRPEAYLHEGVRRGTSVWAMVGETRAVTRLAEDLASGRWAERNGDLLALDEADCGVRLLVA